MSNSPLVNYTRISPNSSSRNGTRITKITPHHMAGNLTVETCGNVFASSSRQASSNYGIGSDGRVGLYVDESRRAWTSSNAANDRAAVTIEVANDEVGGNWHVSDAAWNKLIELCVDICQRNGIKSLSWTGDKSGTLTCHYMFASTSCPGPYLKSRMGELANEVNRRLGNGGSVSTSTPVATDDIDQMARDVIAGKYGNGDQRKAALGANYDAVQARVNQILGSGSTSTSAPAVNIDDLARRVIAGEFGNGDARKAALGSNYDAVQKRVNEMLGSGSSAPAGKSIDELAREVIRGDWGNGNDRKNRLTAAGYDYAAVQARVNQLL